MIYLPIAPQYYDSENISESKLAFRRATSEPWAHLQDDGFCMQVLYDMDRYLIQPTPQTQKHTQGDIPLGAYHAHKKSET